MSVTDSFQRFTGELRSRVEAAQSLGVPDLKQRAADFGDYLAQHVDPQSPEQRLLKEMWQVANEDEQQAIANAMFKLVEQSDSRVH